jgi:Domain of unknown function (DUF4041)/T5orf172 domain
VARRRGFFAEVNHQMQMAERRRQQEARAASRANAAAQREAERAHREWERARAAAARANTAEQKAAAQEAARLHIEAQQAEVEARNTALQEAYGEIDGLLAATLAVDDFVDLERLRVTQVEHPPFSAGGLDRPLAPPPPIRYPLEPQWVEPAQPRGLAALGGKKKHEQEILRQRAEFEAAHQRWFHDVRATDDAYRARLAEHATKEDKRQAALAAARRRYDSDSEQREKDAAARNADLDRLINGLAFDVQDAIEEYVGIVLSNSVYPDSLPVTHEHTFDLSVRELALQVRVPGPADIPSVKEYRYVKAKDEIAATSLPMRDQKARYASAVWQVAVRTLHEVFEADRVGRVRSISLTILTDHLDPATGRPVEVPLVLVAADRETFNDFDLSNVVPFDTLRHLGAALSKSPYDLVAADLSPPGWPTPPPGWAPPSGWKPDASWPAPPDGWSLWLSDESDESPPEQHSPAAGPTAVSPVIDASQSATGFDGDRGRLLARITELERQLAAAKTDAGTAIDLDDERVLQDVGIYRYHHPLENAALYKERLADLQRRIVDVVRGGRPVLAADLFTFDGSLARGRRMVADLSKLMLRAYNAEADNCVRSLRAGNIGTARKRLDAAVASIQKLGAIMEMRINPDYHALRLEELELTADHQMKVQEERERAREEREQLREQRRAEQELAAERERLDKERAHYAAALAALQARGDAEAAADLIQRLRDIDRAIERNDYRAANIRAGYVYVISNVGAFGPDVVKIGLTRRLDPYDRVRELGDASVPFPYDVHALFFSNDAVTLEAELHAAFADRRVNFVNARREFFFAEPAQVRDLLVQRVGGGLLEFNEHPEADEFLRSRGSWPGGVRESRDMNLAIRGLAERRPDSARRALGARIGRGYGPGA